MEEYIVEVQHGGPNDWEGITGFDDKKIVWQATERLTQKEAEDRIDWLVKKYPDQIFRITPPIPPAHKNNG